MAAGKDLRELARQLERQGWRREQRPGGHIVLVPPHGGRPLVLSNSPSRPKAPAPRQGGPPPAHETVLSAKVRALELVALGLAAWSAGALGTAALWAWWWRGRR